VAATLTTVLDGVEEQVVMGVELEDEVREIAGEKAIRTSDIAY
jgi:hypothetical protein